MESKTISNEENSLMTKFLKVLVFSLGLVLCSIVFSLIMSITSIITS